MKPKRKRGRPKEIYHGYARFSSPQETKDNGDICVVLGDVTVFGIVDCRKLAAWLLRAANWLEGK